MESESSNRDDFDNLFDQVRNYQQRGNNIKNSVVTFESKDIERQF